MEFLEDEEFEKWFSSQETQDILVNEIEADEKKIAQFAWQASLELYRTDYCEGCALSKKLLPCRPASNCRKIEEALKTHQPTNGSMASGASAPSAQICPACKGQGFSLAFGHKRNHQVKCSCCSGSGKLHTA